jgi:zinc protease
MKAKSFLALLLAFALAAPSAALAQRMSVAASAPSADQRVLPPINYTEFTLPNGLHVIFHEDHSTPIVAVNVWYHVGSKNEVPGRTGFAHLFEHMMFQGSKNYDENYFTPIQEAGGTLNGSTNSDRTNYWEVVPSNFLELALFMEADRMGTLPEALTQAKLNNQRDVVKNEKRQNYDNRPYGLIGAKIAEMMYPPDHPYHWLTIGSLDDLSAASVDDVKDFFRRFYTPNNASLCVAGDFNPSEARAWVEKYFGAVKRGPEVQKLNVAQPKLDREIRTTVDDRMVTLAREYMNWHTVPHFAKDEAALNMLAAILAGGRTSRLYKSLVYDKQIAQSVNAFNGSREIAGTFQIVATARPQKSLEEIESVINAEIERIKNEPPTAEEMARVYNSIEAEFIYGLQTVGGFGGKSDQLNAYETFIGKPDFFEQDLARYRAVTPSDVQRVAREYLTDKRLILTVAPQAGAAGGRIMARANEDEQPSTANQPTSAAGAKKSGKSIEELKANLPKPKPDPTLTLPRVERRRLSNGLTVEFVRYDKLPIVNMHLLIKTGAAADPKDKAGLAEMTSALMDEGTKSRTSLQISDELANIGARLRIVSGWDATNVNLLATTRQLDRALDIFADVINNPSFPEAEFARQKRQRMIALQQQRENANAIANIVYSSILYGREHPYGHSAIGSQQSLAAISREDVQRFYETYYRPNNATLIVVGNVDANALMPKLERAFGGWKSAEVPKINFSAPPARDKAAIYLVDRPHAAQSVIQIGQVGVARSTPDYFPLLVLNTLLGGSFVSRINLNLREDKGYTYGARTAFEYRMEAGPFVAAAGVQTAVTKESVIEFMKELNDIRGKRPVTPAELEYAKQAIIRGFPRGFETPEQIAANLSNAALYNLPDDYFNNYIGRVRSVTLEDVNRVAQKYLDPSRMAILIVGDQKVIEPGLRSLDNLGASLVLLDTEGRPVAANAGSSSK